MSRPRTHLFIDDVETPPDHLGRRWCTCGAREDHQRHELPADEHHAQAAHAGRYEHDEEGGD